MPGPAFAHGDTVSLHPIEDEDHDFIQYGSNHPDLRRPLGSTTIRSTDDVADLVGDDDYRFLVCVDERSKSTDHASSEGRSPSDHPSGLRGGEAASNGTAKPSRGPREDGEERPASCVDDGDALERVGVVGLPWVFDDSQSGFLMYWVAPEHQGNGYVTEATELLLDYLFRECGFHKVGAFVLESNDASAAVLEKLGFVREGTLRRESFHDGEWTDEYRYGLLADEWLDD